jgi:hypothetical protein
MRYAWPAWVGFVPGLKRQHHVGAHGLELGAQLGRRETVLVEIVIVLNALQELDPTAEQPVAGLVDLLDVRALSTATNVRVMRSSLRCV